MQVCWETMQICRVYSKAVSRAVLGCFRHMWLQRNNDSQEHVRDAFLRRIRARERHHQVYWASRGSSRDRCAQHAHVHQQTQQALHRRAHARTEGLLIERDLVVVQSSLLQHQQLERVLRRLRE